MGFIRAGKAFVGDLVHAKPQNALHSNEAINGNFFTNFGSRLDHAVGVMGKSMDRHVTKVKNSGKMADAELKDGRYSTKDRLEAMYRNEDGSINKSAIAGTAAAGYVGASAAGRIISGGGLYKDADGNTDIIGSPFI